MQMRRVGSIRVVRMNGILKDAISRNALEHEKRSLTVQVALYKGIVWSTPPPTDPIRTPKASPYCRLEISEIDEERLRIDRQARRVRRRDEMGDVRQWRL